MSLNDEIKRRALQQIKRSVRQTGTSNAIKIIVKDVADDNINVGTSGGGGGQFSLTITGLRVVAETMEKIMHRYFTKARQYYTAELVSGTNRNALTSELTATGQTLGQFHKRNSTVEDNRFSFQFPIHPRGGDAKKRKERAKNNDWNGKQTQRNANLAKRNKEPKPILAWDAIQRGARKGQPWKPKMYNEVAGYIEERKGKPIFFSNLQTIQEIIVTELIRELK